MWNNYLNKIRHTNLEREYPCIVTLTRTRTRIADAASTATIATAALLKHHIRIKYNRKNYLQLFVSAVVCLLRTHRSK